MPDPEYQIALPLSKSTQVIEGIQNMTDTRHVFYNIGKCLSVHQCLQNFFCCKTTCGRLWCNKLERLVLVNIFFLFSYLLATQIRHRP
jgi:hypothetical protein